MKTSADVTLDAELVGGPEDGVQLAVPLAQLDHLPQLGKRGGARRYRCYSIDLLDEGPLLYYWGHEQLARIGMNRHGAWVGDLHLCWGLNQRFTGFVRVHDDGLLEGWTLGFHSVQLRCWHLVQSDYALRQKRAVEELRLAICEADANLRQWKNRSAPAA